MRRWLLGLVVLLGSLPALAQGPSIAVVNGYCTLGGAKANVSGLLAVNVQQGIIPGCTITVYQHGTTNLATIFADDNSTPLSNPFTAVVATSPNSGYWLFWAATGAAYDVVASGGTAPVTYPAPQTIWEEFLGAGGGGGGTCPSGNLYDIQIDDPLGTCGSDLGIGQIVPGTHTLYENILNANQQVDVSDATNSGLIALGHSTGSAVDSAFGLMPPSNFSPTPTGGYGVFVPPTPPTAMGQVVTVESATPTNVTTKYGVIPFYPLSFAAASGVGNCPGLAGQNTYCSGPVNSLDPRSAIVQDKMCTIGDTPTCTGGGITIACAVSSSPTSFAHCQFSVDQSITAGDTGYVVFTAVAGLGASGVTNSMSDTQGNTWTREVNIDGSGSTLPTASYRTVLGAGTDVISVNFDTSTGFQFRGTFHFYEMRGTVTSDGFAANSGSGYPFQAVTTTNATDTILGDQFIFSATCAYTPGSLFGLIDILNGTVFSSVTLSTGSEATNVSSTGTYTPSITASGSGCSGTTGSSVTQAFTQHVYGGPGIPSFRWPRYVDLVAGLDFPPQAGNTGKALVSSGFDYQPLQWATVGSGTVTSVTGTTSQIDVATTTTTPVVSLDGQFTSVNYATCTNTADALTVTLSPAPTSLVNGLTVQCRSSAANTTTTPTLKVGALTAHTIVKGGSAGQAALVANDILTNMVARFTYDSGTSTWELQNPQQGGSGTGTVTSIATTSPITGGTITTTGTIACATCVVASSPGAGIARFAGSTQTVTSAEISGDATTSGSNVLTLATVNSNVGSFTAANITVNDKGLITAATNGSGGASGVFKTETANYTVLAADFSTPFPACGNIFIGAGAASTLTVTLTANTSQPAAGQCIEIWVYANSIVTVSPSGQNLQITGSTGNYTMVQGQGLRVVSDGTNYSAISAQSPASDSNNDTWFGHNIFGYTNGQTTIFGESNGNSGASGGGNTYVGTKIAQSATGAQQNTVLGYNAFHQGSSGSQNVCIGLSACGTDQGSGNTVIGSNDGGTIRNGSNNIVLGSVGNADVPSGSTSNYVALGNFIYGDQSKGILILKGSATTISSNACGSTVQGSLKSGSNDMSGEVTVGTVAVTSCVVSFANTHNVVPNCVVSDQSLGGVSTFGYSASTTALTITAATGLSGTVVDYFCPAATTSATPTP